MKATTRSKGKLLARPVEPAPRKCPLNTGARRRRSEGTEPSSRHSQILLNRHGKWMTDTEHALRGPFYLLERRHGLAHPSAEILDRPVDVLVERLTSSAHASTATATASLYFLSAWYCSALPPRCIFLHICLWPRRQWSCWQVLLQYLV